jgi:hypothetical protein
MKKCKLYVIRKGGEKQKSKLCIDYNDAIGSVVTYSITRKRMKNYYQNILCHFLDLVVFSLFVIFRKHGGKYTCSFAMQCAEIA